MASRDECLEGRAHLLALTLLLLEALLDYFFLPAEVLFLCVEVDGLGDLLVQRQVGCFLGLAGLI